MRSATCPTTARPSPSRCWPGPGRPRRRCWPTSGGRASCGCTRCWAAAPCGSTSTARQVELDDGTVLDGRRHRRRHRAPRRGSSPGTEGLGPARRPLHAADARRLAGPARGGDGGRSRPGSSSSGPGFIGAEVASTCAGLGCRVTVLEALDIPLRNRPRPDARRALRVAARRPRGRAAHRGRGAAASRRDAAGASGGHGLVVELERRRGCCRPTSWWSASAWCPRPTGWPDSGLTVENGVVCDDRLFAADGIVAAGDVARWMWRHDGERGADPDRALAGGGRGGRRRGAQPAGRPRRRAALHARPLLLVRPVRHPLPGPREPAGRRRGARSSRGRSTRGSSSRCSAARVACARSWPSASRAS